MLLTVISLSLLGSIAGWAAMYARGVLTPALNTVQIVTVLVLLILLVADWRRLMSQRAVELGCLLYAVVVCAACMALSMYWPQYGTGLDLQPLYLWIPVIYVFTFTLTDYKTGLRISLGILLLFVAISLPYLLRGGGARYGNFTLQLHFVSAVLIAALYHFSSYQHRLAFAQRTVDQLARLSNTDELTHLANRRHMAAVITRELALPQDTAHRFAVMLFDIDRFKLINDQFGHHVGDRALAALAQRASAMFPGPDTLGRWGGDEFVAVVRGMDDATAHRRAQELCHRMAAEPLFDGHPVTVSCGVTVRQAGDSIDSLLQRADAALYAAKRAGRNRAERIAAESTSEDRLLDDIRA